MGSIPFRPATQIREPWQRAAIAWNGKEEILLLSTTLAGSAETDVLEVMPLPSKPVVEKGTEELFDKANALISEALGMETREYRIGGGGTLDAGAAKPAGEVASRKRIGAHDITVTHVLDSAGFVEWVEEYLTAAKVKNPVIPAPMKAVIEEYLADGFSWFVFDVVHVSRTAADKQPIRFRFKSDFLYYPLRITRIEKGKTRIKLFVFSLSPLKHELFRGISPNRIKLLHPILKVRRSELADLDAEICELLNWPRISALRVWEITGKLAEFDKDLLVCAPPAPRAPKKTR